MKMYFLLKQNSMVNRDNFAKYFALLLFLSGLISCSPKAQTTIPAMEPQKVVDAPTLESFPATLTPTLTIQRKRTPTITEPIVQSTATLLSPTPTKTNQPTSIPPILPLTRFVIAGDIGDWEGLPILNTQGKIQRQIAKGVHWPDSVSWSPDGHWVAFTASFTEGENFDIYVTNVADNEFKRLTFPPHDKFDVDWSPNGELLVYVEGGEDTDVAIVSMVNQKSQKLTYTGGYKENPKWSPDARQIAYLYREEWFKGNSQLYVMNADGTNHRQIADLPVIGPISWSPDGQFIAFSASPSSCGTIQTVNVESGEITQLTNQPGCYSNPVWSGDGKYIAYLKKSGESTWEIHIMQSDGSNDYSITPSYWSPRNIAWSPVPILEIGNTYMITEAGANLNLRQEPSLSSPSQLRIQEGEYVLVLDGPVDQDNYYWWHLRTEDGIEGWAVEFFGWYQEIE